MSSSRSAGTCSPVRPSIQLPLRSSAIDWSSRETSVCRRSTTLCSCPTWTIAFGLAMRLSHRPGPNSSFGIRCVQSRPERRLRCHTASDLELFPVDPLFAGVADEYDSWSVGPVVPPLQPPRSSPVQALDGGSALTVGCPKIHHSRPFSASTTAGASRRWRSPRTYHSREPLGGSSADPSMR